MTYIQKFTLSIIFTFLSINMLGCSDGKTTVSPTPPTIQISPALDFDFDFGTITEGNMEHPMMFGPTVFGTTPGQVGPRTIPEFTSIENRRSFKRIPSVPDGDWKKGNRHIQEWIAACKTGEQPSANFGYSARLTEMVLLGNVALQSGAPIEWDSDKLTVTNLPRANRLLRRKYRNGWTL